MADVEHEPKPEVESTGGAEPTAEAELAARPDAAPPLKRPTKWPDGDTHTERAQSHDGVARALAPLPDVAPPDGGSRLDVPSGGVEQRLLPLEQLTDNSRQAQAPGPGGQSPFPPPACRLTPAGLVCAGAENCVVTSGGAICTQNGIPCVVTSAGSQCVPGCTLTSAGLVCPSGCTLTSAGVRCPLVRVLGRRSGSRKPTRRRKPTRELGRSGVLSAAAAPTPEAARVSPPERGPRLGDLPFTGAPLHWQVALACMLVAAGVLLACRTRARER